MVAYTTGPPYWHYTASEIASANDTDLPDLLASLGYQVRRVGSYYTTREMDSLRIKNRRTWWRYSELVGGDAIDFLRHFHGLSFAEAVRYLLEYGGYPVDLPAPPPIRKPRPPPRQERPPFVLPPANGDNGRVCAYLRGRGIAPGVIDDFVAGGLLYEDAVHQNCVFVGRDSTGKAVFAAQRGTYDRIPFRGDVAGSDKRIAFRAPYDPALDWAAVFEAPIDLMSCSRSTANAMPSHYVDCTTARWRRTWTITRTSGASSSAWTPTGQGATPPGSSGKSTGASAT